MAVPQLEAATGSEVLIVASAALVAGSFFGYLASRVRLPREIGYIAAGFLIGPMGINLFGSIDIAASMSPVTTYALGFIAAMLGAHLRFRRIADILPRAVIIAATEGLAAFGVTLAVCRAMGADWIISVALGAVAIATSPATILVLVQEHKARGPFTRLLLAVVAMDVVLCLLVFATAFAILEQLPRGAFSVTMVAGVLGTLALSVLLGGLGAETSRRLLDRDVPDMSVAAVLLIVVGISEAFRLNMILAGLTYGIYIANISDDLSHRFRVAEVLSMPLYASFFVVAGAALHMDAVLKAGLLAVVFMAARIAGKVAGTLTGATLTGWPVMDAARLGLALAPHSGISVALVLMLEGRHDLMPAYSAEFIGTVVLGAVTVNELIGPLITEWALKGSGETGLDRPFIKLSHIIVGMPGGDKWRVLERVAAIFARRNRLGEAATRELLEALFRREREASTAIGHGVAVPHAWVSSGKTLRVILAVCRDPVDFEPPDGEPIRLIFLIVAPRSHQNHYLEALAGIASFARSRANRERLLAAQDRVEAWMHITEINAAHFDNLLDLSGSA